MYLISKAYLRSDQGDIHYDLRAGVKDPLVGLHHVELGSSGLDLVGEVAA